MTPPPLPEAVSGKRLGLDTNNAGFLSYYISQHDGDEPPLLLIHSVNAAAAAHEVRPLFEHYAKVRTVIAPDLPGFGFSERSRRDYTPRMMTDAIHAVVSKIREEFGDEPVDALAVSLSSEFLARAASEAPDQYRSVALVSPTSMNKRVLPDGPPESTRGIAWLHRTFTLPGLGQGLFSLLTSRASVRFFLEKTWGSKRIDEEMFEYSWRTANQPDALHAPFRFLTGFLFSGDIGRIYRALDMPVWMSHGVRGDFTDYRRKVNFENKANWHFDVFDAGALPYFEQTEQFIERYDTFRERALATVEAG